MNVLMSTNSIRSSKAAINSSSSSDDDHDDDDIIRAVFPRSINPRPSSAGHNHRSVVDSSESEDDQGLAQLYKTNQCLIPQPLIPQPRPRNDISSLLRMMMMMNLNQRIDAGAGRSQLIINRDRRPVADYAEDSTDDEGLTHHYGKIKHFSHPHNLNKYNIPRYSEANCEVCGLQLVGSAYGCQSCQFYLHASCFDLPQKIQHGAHLAHPLTLRYPSYYKHCGKTCDACSEHIQRSFLYCCDLCRFDLHVTCATLYAIVKRANTSKDTLRLYYTFPVGDNNIIVRCNVCNKKVPKEGWSYYSKDTGHIAHIKCVKDAKVGPSWIKERLNMIKIK